MLHTNGDLYNSFIRNAFGVWALMFRVEKWKAHSTDEPTTHVAHNGDFKQNGFCVFVDDKQARTALMN